MKVRSVDPRDIRSEISVPIYRVIYWTALGEAELRADEYEITEADDVESVLEWARECRPTLDDIEVYVVVGTVLVRLLGRATPK